jgi:hypothetical protein
MGLIVAKSKLDAWTSVKGVASFERTTDGITVKFTSLDGKKQWEILLNPFEVKKLKLFLKGLEAEG